MKPPLGMVVAFASEARKLLGRGRWQRSEKLMTRRIRLSDGTDLIAVRAGVGLDNALIAARWLISENVSVLINVGVAGGLYPHLKAGDLIIADAVIQLKGKTLLGPWIPDVNLVAQSRTALNNAHIYPRCGTVVSSKVAVLSAIHKASLFENTRSLAVDMESAAVAQAAEEAGLRFFILRAICDPAETTVARDLSNSLGFDGNVRPLTLFLNLTRRPYLISDLIRMGRHYAIGSAALRHAWHILIQNRLFSSSS
ncbi:MAG: hypothetical protein PVI71_07460 [Desulfobacterales bacterium]